MNDEEMIQVLSELANKNRLAIYRLLIKRSEGLTVGEIGKKLDMPLSTLNFHLSGLKNAVLIIQDKKSRSVYCFAQLDILNKVLEKLNSECCSDS